MFRWRGILRNRRAPVLPGSIPALLFLAFLLTFLGSLTPTVGSSRARPVRVGTLQPVGGEGDSSSQQGTVATPARRRAVSAPKPLVIRDEVQSVANGPERIGSVEPAGARCIIQIGGCRLDLEFENRTNGWTRYVDIRFQLSRAGRSIKKGYILGSSELVAPSGSRTVSERVDDISFDSYQLELCVVRFDWLSSPTDAIGQMTRSDTCLSKTMRAEA